MIYFLGIPLQIAIILWSALIKKSEMGKNTRQIKKEKRRKSKELKKEKELEKTDLVNKEENNTPVAESKEDLDTAKNYTESNKTINGKEESNSKGQKKHESIEDDDFGYDFFKEKNDIK